MQKTDSFEEFDFRTSSLEHLIKLLENGRLIAGITNSAIVSSSLSPSELKKMWGAVLSLELGLQSVDYTIKRYVEGYGAELEHEKAQIRPVERLVKDEVLRVKNKYVNIKHDNVILGHHLSHTALIRMESSFSSIIVLLRMGYYFELYAIMRMIYEQLSWVYAVHGSDDIKECRIEPQKSIGKLKELYPSAGKTYGFLSEISHIVPKAIGKYVHHEGENVMVTVSFQKEMAEVRYVMATFAHLYCALWEITHKEWGEDFQYIEVVDDNVIIVQEHPLRSVIKDAKSNLQG